MAKTPRTQQGGSPDMRDPQDRDIHDDADRAYPDSPKGVKEPYTDGGDLADAERHEGHEKEGVYRGIREKGLETMSEQEYRDWLKGRTQNT
jgi:hypothetical protein